MRLSNISNIISASSHLLPPPSTAITSALTSASTSENKPKSNAGRPPFPLDENGNGNKIKSIFAQFLQYNIFFHLKYHIYIKYLFKI